MAITLSAGGVFEYKKMKLENQKKSSEEKVDIVTNTNPNIELDTKNQGLNDQKSAKKATKEISTDKNEDKEDEDESETEDHEENFISKPSPGSTTNPTAPKSTVNSYTMAQIKIHNSAQSCWTAINGSVYDVTSWIRQHPGGSAAIISLCGVDGTSAFTGQHGTQGRPASELSSFKIGVLI